MIWLLEFSNAGSFDIGTVEADLASAPFTVSNSITAAGFSNNPYDWFIARHDVYGEPFMEKWSKAETEADAFNMTEFDDALDDITLLHEEDED
ncbi:unnamed protein product [Phytophthora lilii]|uniref:Unnamed protein product n=1 Tax=Phytophthora lilii TaxID=2077276 RepID=A0A9W7CN68_9STRA|nr:unnamed protein product [Phytophthora lilii]